MGPEPGLVRHPLGLVFFAWGEIYSLFPSTCTDTFGSKFAATNAGMLYTAKGTAALLVPLGNYLQQSTGNWDAVFLIAAAANILASVLAIAVLKPCASRLSKKARSVCLPDNTQPDNDHSGPAGITGGPVAFK